MAAILFIAMETGGPAEKISYIFYSVIAFFMGAKNYINYAFKKVSYLAAISPLKFHVAGREGLRMSE